MRTESLSKCKQLLHRFQETMNHHYDFSFNRLMVSANGILLKHELQQWGQTEPKENKSEGIIVTY